MCLLSTGGAEPIAGWCGRSRLAVAADLDRFRAMPLVPLYADTTSERTHARTHARTRASSGQCPHADPSAPTTLADPLMSEPRPRELEQGPCERVAGAAKSGARVVAEALRETGEFLLDAGVVFAESAGGGAGAPCVGEGIE